MLLVVIGTAIVGSQSLVCPDPTASSSSSGSSSKATIGNVLIIIAQLVVATQMVIEEKFLAKYDLPALKVRQLANAGAAPGEVAGAMSAPR